MHPKGYPHVDPNEDAVCAGSLDGKYLLAVADGHNGFEAAFAAITAVHDEAGALLELPPGEAAAKAMSLAAAAVRSTLLDRDDVRRESGTALGIAVVCDGRVGVSIAGDVTIALIGKRRAQCLGRNGAFLNVGGPSGAPGTSARLKDDKALLVASDGLIDFLGQGWEAELPTVLDGDPLVDVTRLIELAGQRGAGDNVSAALLKP